MSDIYESMALISQAVKSDMPLGEAIRISVSDVRDRSNRGLLRLADLLDEGMEPLQAAKRAGLPKRLVEQLETAFGSGDFADYFEELTLAERARQEAWRVFSLLAFYPLLLGFSVALLAFLGLLILPQFERIFTDFDENLPLMTLLVFRVGHALQQPIVWICTPLLVLLLIVMQRWFFPTFWYYIPIVGRIFRTQAMQKLLRQIAVSLRRRLPLDESLKIAAGSFSHRAYRQECLHAAAMAAAGTTFSSLIVRFPLLFPRWLVPFVEVGGRKDALPHTLFQAQKIL